MALHFSWMFVLVFSVRSVPACISTLFFAEGQKRVKILGWICMIFALCVFVAPLGILSKIIKTKSVEYMPFTLSFFLTLSAVLWFFYGYFKKDQYVAVPNILGFLFGIIQMVVYMIYKNPRKVNVEEPRLEELTGHKVVDVAKLTATINSKLATVAPVIVPVQLNENLNGIEVVVVEDDQNVKEKTNKVIKQAMEDGLIVDALV